jgi:TRAP-type C4-dicarboxylate transport system permease small subunit
MMKLGKLVNFGIPIFGGMLLVAMIAITFLQIILRELCTFSLNWSDEVTQFCMTWLTLFGSIWVTKNNQHLTTGLKLQQKLNGRQVHLIESILDLVIAGFTAVVAYQSAIYSFALMAAEAVSLPWIKMGFVYIALPIAMLAMCYYHLKSFLLNLKLIFKKGT